MIDEKIFRRNDGTYQCTECSYSSTKSSHVKRHISRLHLDMEPFSCTVCNKTFKTEDTRIKHYRSAHNMQVGVKDIRIMQARKNLK